MKTITLQLSDHAYQRLTDLTKKWNERATENGHENIWNPQGVAEVLLHEEIGAQLKLF